MSVSIHLARFGPSGTVRALRRRQALERVPGLAFSLPFVFAAMDPVTGGFPLPTRVGALCDWADADARDAAVAPGGPMDALAAGAKDAWHAALDPAMVVMGTLGGWTPSTDGVAPLASGEPCVVLTHGVVRPRYLWRFTVDNRTIVREMREAPGLQHMYGVLGSPMMRATISFWDGKREMVRFAYGGGTHKPVQREAQDVPWADEFFFARFRPVASRGTWPGQDPLPGLPAAAA